MGNAHNMNYSRIFMLGKSSAADFLGFSGIQPACWNRLRWRALFMSIPERIMASCAGWSSTPSPAGGARHLEGSGFKSLVPDGQPVTVKVEDLDPISATVEEEEEMAGQEVLSKALLNQPGKAVKAFSHVGRSRSRGTCARPRRA